MSWQFRTELLQPRLDLVVLDRCGQSGHFDKKGFNEARNLQCPMEGCGYVWCKRCQKEVLPNGPEHSCDGSSAEKAQNPLFSLLQRGWTFDYSWKLIRTRVDVNARVQPGDIRVQLVSALYLAVRSCLTQCHRGRFQGLSLKLPTM